MTSPSAAPTSGDPLAPFRAQQEKDAARGPRRAWPAVVLFLVSLAGGVWIFTDLAGPDKSMVLSVGMGVLFAIVVWVMGTFVAPATRPRRTRPVVRVTGRDLVITRNGSPVSALPMTIFMGVIGAGMLWFAFAALLRSPLTRDIVIGWLVVLCAVLLLCLVLPVFLLPEIGPTSVRIVGTTLTVRVGLMSSYTVPLNRHTGAQLFTYRGQQQLRLTVYPPVESRMLGIRKRRRTLPIPPTAFPEMNLFPLIALIKERGLEGAEASPKKDYEVLPEFRPATTVTAAVILVLLAAAVVVPTGCDPVLAALGALVLFLPVTGASPRGSILRPELSGGQRGWSVSWRIRCDYPWLLLGPLMAALVLVIVVGIRGLLGTTPNASLGWLLLIAGAAAPLMVWGYQVVGACVLAVDDEEVLHIRLGRLVRARVALADITTAEVDTVLWHRVRVRSEGRIHLRLLGSDFDVSTVTVPAPFIHGVDTGELAALLTDRSTAARRGHDGTALV